MNEPAHSASAILFADTLAARLGRHLSQRERAAIAQLVHELREQVPYGQPPRLQTVTVLIADLRGFSALAASSDPETLVALVQPFFTRMTGVIHDHGGFVDKFLGDGIMALFGAPSPLDDHLHSALSCAAQMQRAMVELNDFNAARQLPTLFAGIGINSGEAMGGSFGGEDYREYTVIGDPVNLAARIEKFALRGEVLLSERCARAAADGIEIADTRLLRVRGQSGPVTLHSLAAVTHPQRIEVPRPEMRSSPRVRVDLPLRFHSVEEQRVLPQEYAGSILNLGYGGMLARLPLQLAEMGEITFGLTLDPTAARTEDVYARALHQHRSGDAYDTALAFTSLGRQGSETVRRYVDQMLWGS